MTDLDRVREDLEVLADCLQPAGFKVPTCATCGHAVGDHSGASSTVLHISRGPCFRCDCPRYQEAA